MAKKQKTTTRSYTLGLLAPMDAPDWLPLCSRLFRTHHAICQGAKEFGEFYLNLRGGLPASLADGPDKGNEQNDRRLRRGARRMLALGWLSVEDAHGAENHAHKIREAESGKSLSRDLAERLLRDILITHKGVSQEGDLSAWVDDCILALTANIRSDAVFVNRAAAFADWQKSVGTDGLEMPDQAQRILFSMCGSGFVSLTLPDEASLKAENVNTDFGDDAEPENEAAAGSKTKDEDAVEPSNASRGVFGDLFGGDAAEKLSRLTGKDEFAVSVCKCLNALGDVPPTPESIIAFRTAENLPDLDTSDPEKYPAEVSSSGAPTAVAKRYRKLLVCLGLWPTSDNEDGIPRTQAVANFGKRVSTENENARRAQINAWDLIDACPKQLDAGSHASETPPPSQRVFKPSWANALADRVAMATRMPAEAKSLNEFKRLMFALAARRISQTQSWTKLNEIERHKAAVKEDAARARLLELDAEGRARKWLIEYEYKRAELSAALSGFRITKRMIGECDAVFEAWQKSASLDERDKQTASVQSGAEKFGDATLYADLSTDPDAEFIWRHTQGSEILKEWVKFRQAQFDQQRRKIPRFCHPDTFHHPTWCEFGGSSKPKVWYAWSSGARPQNPEPGGNADGSRQLWLQLPNLESKQAKAVPMRWRSKRLAKDLGGVRDFQEQTISRADRLGLAAANLPVHDKDGSAIRYRPKFPFSDEAKGWNARLQISRESLLKLERHWDHQRGEWQDSGKALRSARWFVTFAPALAISDGPGRQIHPKLGWGFPYPHSELNKKQKRGLHAQLVLSRLPGLRVLSVDLGHRFAAACAVWETLTLQEMKDACKVASHREPQAADQFVHLSHLTDKLAERGRNKGQRIVETVIYRRIGENFLRDPKTGLPTDTEHQAPWASLNRQFLIKLPGEEQPARLASDAEIEAVKRMEAELGRQRSEKDVLPTQVDKLMGEAVRTIRLAVRRLGDTARIAYAFMPGAERHNPGGGKNAHTPETRKDAVIDALVRWRELCGGTSNAGWIDPLAIQHWDDHIRPKLTAELPVLAEDATGQERKKYRGELAKALDLVAEELAGHGDLGTPELFQLWQDRWKKDSDAWMPRLKWIRSWMLPKGLRSRRKDPEEIADARKARRAAARNVGGLSLERITTIRELYQVQKAYHSRPHADNPRAGIELMEAESAKGWKFGDRLLTAMERMREQRVKQLSSRIAGSALGLGGHWKQVDTRRKNSDGTSHLKMVWVEEPTAKYDPCHAIVIENLTNYRPDELQTRRENRQLMSWSSSKVKKYLSEACQLHGLHLREVTANYTSQQDSRTGLPGVRCADVHVDPTTGEPKAYWWKKAVSSALKKVNEKKTDAEAHYFVNLHAHLKNLVSDGKPIPETVRVPRKGGDLFVSAPPWSCQSNGHQPCPLCDGKRALQADLNAAANIGLRALLDPDFTGKWWFIPCESATHKPLEEKTRHSAVIASALPLFVAATKVEAGDTPTAPKKGKAKPAKKQREIINLWRDISVSPIDANSKWRGTAEYWNGVRSRVISLLGRQK